jgi:predicted RNase H-like nuclease (RuvC/YqgF family)
MTIEELQAENARLKAEVERLTRTIEVADNHAQCLEMVINAGTANELRLKAEVERLTKAGDAMADNCEAMTSSEHDCYDSDLMKFVRAWNAAKAGKQS